MGKFSSVNSVFTIDGQRMVEWGDDEPIKLKREKTDVELNILRYKLLINNLGLRKSEYENLLNKKPEKFLKFLTDGTDNGLTVSEIRINVRGIL